MIQQATPSSDDAWLDARRVEAWAGELRINVIRLLALLAFYVRHLVEYFRAAPTDFVRGPYHLQVTAICIAWAAGAMLLHALLVHRRVNRYLPHIVVVFDAMLITAILALHRDPQSPLVLLYVVLIATAALRLSIQVVWLATGCAIVGYLAQLAYYAWRVIGYDKYYATPELRIPRAHEAIVMLSLIVAGAIAGQSVRQARRLAAGFVQTTRES